MGFWLIFTLVAIAVGSTVLTALLAPRPPAPRPSALGDFQFPTAQEGRVIPAIFGGVKIAGPNVTWYGDLRTVPVKVKSGLFSKSTIGYEYWLGLQMALCYGPVQFVGITAGTAPDDIEVPFGIIEQTDDFVRIVIDSPEIFGGERREGGLRGEVKLYLGTETQESDSYLSEKLGITAPEYRGLAYAVFKQVYMGTTNYPRPINFILRRQPNNLGALQVGNPANPADIIFDAMTDKRWGLGLASSRFDLATWQEAAETLLAEGMLMSLNVDRDQEAQAFIEDIQRHIDAVVYSDPQTGLWKIALIRADYDVGDLLELGEEDLTEAPELSRGSWEQTWNEVKVEYIDGATYKPAVVQAHDSANQQTRGAVYGESLEFLGFTNATIATEIAMRELKAHSYPFARVTLKAKRKAWELRVGSVFKLAWPATGIETLVFRVLSIDYGRLERGVIEIEAVEDAFAVAYAAFDPPDPTQWEDPIAEPAEPEAQLLVESPLEWLDDPDEAVKVLIGCVRGDGVSTGFEIYADQGPGFSNTNTGHDFMPSGLLEANYGRDTDALDPAGFTLEGGRDLEALAGTDEPGRMAGDCLLQFHDTGEICGFQTVTDNGDGTFTFENIVRGVYDTFPADHPLGTRVSILRDAGAWFLVPVFAEEGT